MENLPNMTSSELARAPFNQEPPEKKTLEIQVGINLTIFLDSDNYDEKDPNKTNWDALQEEVIKGLEGYELEREDLKFCEIIEVETRD